MHSFTFPKSERLKSRKQIASVFSKGIPVYNASLKAMLLKNNIAPEEFFIKVTFSVPKRSVPKAVNRNLIKRRMLEAYRLCRKEYLYQFDHHKQGLGYYIVFIYQSKELQTYQEIQRNMKSLLKKIAAKN